MKRAKHWMVGFLIFFCFGWLPQLVVPATANGPFDGGAGSLEDPYLIRTPEQLDQVRNYPDAFFKQTADIALNQAPWNEGEGWQPIGDSTTPFSGTYDGNGKWVSGLFINRPAGDDQGLFGCVNGGAIRNLGLSGVEVTGKNDVGAITGRRGGQGGISGCAVSGSVKGVENVGGLLGYNDTGGSQSVDEVRVSESYAAVAVTGERFVGGLIGQNLGVVSLCYATGSVTGTAFTGGLIGYDTDTTIWSSFWDKEASGQEGSSGGKGLSTGEMKTLRVYRNAGWNQSAWTMTEGEYPRLAWEQTGAAVLGPPDPLPLSGSGTTDAPYVIHTAADLSQLSWYAEALDAHFVLATDIDCGGTRLYPLGDLGQFEGHFDGQGHSLSNVLIHQPGSDFVGLFSKIGYEGRVSRLRLETVQINGKERVGGLAGEITGGYEVREEEDGSFKVDLTFGVIDGCEVTGAVGAGNFGGGLVGMMFGGQINDSRGSVEVTGESYLGGLVGYAGIGIIDTCSATGSVSGQDRVGGLVGFLLGVDVLRHIDGQQFKLGLIRDAVAGGTVSAKTYVGGLVGLSEEDGAEISRCSSSASVSGEDYVGGIAGANQWRAVIRESRNTGTVSGNRYVGGLAGAQGIYPADDEIQEKAGASVQASHSIGQVTAGEYGGGLVGVNGSGSTIAESYNLGPVNGTNRLGGLAGIQYSAVIDRCFSTGKVTASNWFAGGLVGDNQQGSAVRESYSTGGVEALQSVGGLVGWNTHGTISKAYATGNLAGNSRGGLVESMFVGSIVGGYWDTEATGVAASAGGEGRTTEAMTYPHGADTYTDWDFQAVWAADEDASRNGGYPWLRGVTPEPGQIALQVQTPDTGTVAGGGTFSRGTVVTLVATAADNHHFVHWTENGRIVSQDAEYSFIVADGRDLVAHFAIDRYEVVLSADPAGSGTTTGAGTYDHGSQITVAAQPADGYRFIQWTEAGATVSTEAQYQFTVQGPRTLQAQFDHAIVFAGGSGTESDPYQVASPLHLYNLRRYPGACFEQTADIDLNTAPWNEAEGWSPIGWVADGFDFDAQETFSGVFDGKGFVIRNLTLNRPAVAIQGLFGLMTGGEIRNVVMENADVHGDSDVGALVGVVQGGKVVHCRVSGSVTSQWHGVGGLVGRLEADGEISHCVSSVAVTGNSGMAGGLVGQTLGTIRGSRASGPVIGGWYAGGFAGGTPAGLIEDCYATGSVTDPEGLGPVGGFAGGERWGDMAELVIRNCYATGEVGDAEEAGGLVSIWGPPEGGEGFQGRVENSYWDMDTTTEAQSAAGEGRTTAQMTWPHGADTYQGWDFTTVWRADEDGTRNNGYPCLRMPGDADFFLTYLAGPNGFLEGATQQGVMAGESGSPVRAVAAAGYRFVGWSDGLGANPRTDVDVTATITVTADFKMIGDLNLNGRIDTGDALWAIGQAAGLADLDAVQKKLGNITGQADDDLPRLADAVQILGILTRPLGTNASD